MLTKLRESMEEAGIEKGLNMSNVRLRLGEEDQKALEQYKGVINDIGKLKQEYVNLGGSDPTFLKNLDNLEQFYRMWRMDEGNRSLIENS